MGRLGDRIRICSVLLCAALVSQAASGQVSGDQVKRAVRRGVQAILDEQQADGTWRERRYPGELRKRIEYKGHASPWWEFTLVSPDALRAAGDESGWQFMELLGEPANGIAILERVDA